MVTKLVRMALGLFVVNIAACESILEIPVGLQGSERYVCENQNCTCTCGYVKCTPEEETCENHCDSHAFLSAPTDSKLATETPTLLAADEQVYAVYKGTMGGTPGLVCRRHANARTNDPSQCVPCEYAYGELSMVAFEGSLHVAGRDGTCVFGLSNLERQTDLLPSASRSIVAMTVDAVRNELVWLELATKAGQSMVMYRKKATGETTSVALAAHNLPFMLVAHDGRVVWKVKYDTATTCDTLYTGPDDAKASTCLVLVDDKNPDPTAVEQRKLPANHAIMAMAFVEGELYYAVREKPSGGAIRRSTNVDPTNDQTLASNAAVISSFWVQPTTPGNIELYYGTYAGIVYGGRVNLSSPSSMDMTPLTGFGDSTLITALAIVPDRTQAGTMVFLNGRQQSGSGSKVAPELRRLEIIPFSCPAQP